MAHTDSVGYHLPLSCVRVTATVAETTDAVVAEIAGLTQQIELLKARQELSDAHRASLGDRDTGGPQCS